MTALALMLGLALAVALVIGGAVGALASNNALKKVAAVLTAFIGAGLALAVMGAPSLALVVVAALGFAYCLVGVAIVVRLQEAYSSIEFPDLDAADEQDEPREPTT